MCNVKDTHSLDLEMSPCGSERTIFPVSVRARLLLFESARATEREDERLAKRACEWGEEDISRRQHRDQCYSLK